MHPGMLSESVNGRRYHFSDWQKAKTRVARVLELNLAINIASPFSKRRKKRRRAGERERRKTGQDNNLNNAEVIFRANEGTWFSCYGAPPTSNASCLLAEEILKSHVIL